MAAFFWWVLPLFIMFMLLFASVDVWYFVRLALLYLKMRGSGKTAKRRSKEELHAPYDLHGVVLPSDLDHMFHMNNSRYLREMDFGRVGMVVERGVYAAVVKCGGTMSLAAHCIRYRRPLTLFQRFTLRTRVLCWEDEAVYVEQRMIRTKDGFVCAINLAKLVLRGATVSRVMKRWLGEELASPAFPPEVASWRESIGASSKNLLEERLHSR